MKTRVFLFVLLLALAGGATWFFLFADKTSDSQIQKWVPSNSLALITVGDIKTTVADYEQYAWWDEAKSLPFLEQLVQANSKIDSLVQNGVLQSKINENPVYISLHVTSNNSIAPVFFIKSEGFEWLPTNIRKLTNIWFGRDVLFDTRVFNEQIIYETDDKHVHWGFITVGDFLVVSPNSVLLEDVMRTEEGEDYRMIKEDLNYDVSSNTGVKVLLNTQRLNKLRSVFTGKNGGAKEYLESLIDLTLEPVANGFKLNGVSLSKETEVAQTLPPLATVNVENFIPSSATEMRWVGVEASKEINGLDVEGFLKLQNSSICEIQLDLGGAEEAKVIISEVTDLDEAKADLNQLSVNSRAAGDTLFTETYNNQEIRFINKEGLLSNIYGSEYQELGKPYYVFFNSVLLLSDNIDALKTVLSDYEAENTWGRIPEKRRYLDNLIKEANITQLNNFEYFSDPLLNSFNPKWQAFFKKHEPFFSSFENFNFQINETSSRWIVSAELTFNESVERSHLASVPSSSASGEALTLVSNTFSEANITTKPFVVKNHDNGEQEVVFQDELNQLYLTDKNGNILWKEPLEGPILGSIEQVDFYANRKLQYLIFTDSAVHLIDRNGSEVAGFPKRFQSELPISQFRVVDYDNSKNYRYATADRRGNVYLLDKSGEPLEGWNPKAMGFALRGAPEHVRIRGRDCFVIVKGDGGIDLTNRRGESYPGFPYNTGKRISGDYYIYQGPSFSESYIHVLSDDGELLKVDFNGKVKNRNQMLKPAVSSSFIAVKDKLNSGLLSIRRDRNQLTFFDQNGKKKFDKPMATTSDFVFEYYNFRNDNELYLIQNLSNGDLVILDGQGEEKLVKEGFTVNPVGVIYYRSRREYELFVNSENQLAIYTFAN